MRLIDNLYDIIDETCQENTLTYTVRFHADHVIYQAHFPGNPITPGVCLLQMATELLERKYETRLLLYATGNIKFKRPVLPSDTPSLVFTKVVFDGEQLTANVSVENEETQFAKMTLRCKTLNA